MMDVPKSNDGPPFATIPFQKVTNLDLGPNLGLLELPAVMEPKVRDCSRLTGLEHNSDHISAILFIICNE